MWTTVDVKLSYRSWGLYSNKTHGVKLIEIKVLAVSNALTKRLFSQL